MAKKKVVKPPVIDEVAFIKPELTEDPVEKALDEIQKDEVKDLAPAEESSEPAETTAVVSEEPAVEAELLKPLVEEASDETPEPVIYEAPVQAIVEDTQASDPTPEPENETAAAADIIVEAPIEKKEVISKPLAEWSLEEVKAFVKGEASKTGAVTEKEVVEHGGSFVKAIDPKWEKWGFKDVFKWLKFDQLPDITSGGHHKLDPNRTVKTANEWTEDELVDFLKGELKATRIAQAEDLADMVRVKWRITKPWSDAEVKAFVLLNETPLLTENGYWKNDILRETKPAKYWTTNELKAFASGEIGSTNLATEEQLWNAIRLRSNLTENTSIERLQQSLAEYKEEELAMSLTFIRYNLDRYNVTMGKGVQVDETTAAAAQGLFYNTVNRVLRLPGQEFVDGFTMILDFVNLHRNTMFDERHSYRGVSMMTTSDRDRRNHEQLLNLIIKTSNPETRYGEAKNTNFLAALNEISDEEVRQRILSYYQIG
jgi:hypothetical protein